MPTSKKFRDNIHAKGTDIAVLSSGDSDDYISLTDIARYKSDAPDDVIKNWMRNRDTIEFLGLWEQLNNPEFKPVEFDGFKTQAGSNAFTMSPKKLNYNYDSFKEHWFYKAILPTLKEGSVLRMVRYRVEPTVLGGDFVRSCLPDIAPVIEGQA